LGYLFLSPPPLEEDVLHFYEEVDAQNFLRGAEAQNFVR
jgi:hypothetical protein